MAQSTPLKPGTILIVESEVLVRYELLYQVRALGLEVLVADDADEAISLLEAHPEIDVVLTDIVMPGSMDGLRLAHHVRHRWPPVKIIVASGMLDTRMSDLPLNCYFLPKPFGPDALAQALAHA
jgi:CheY-like chemotaxis protein